MLILLDKAVYGFVLLVGEIATLVGVFLVQHFLGSADEEALEMSDEEELKALEEALEDEESA